MKNYYIKSHYKTNSECYFDDTPFKDEWQRDVYINASELCKTHGYNTVVDIGCGSGYKLIKYFPNQDTIGVDLLPTVKFLNNTYPNNKWIVASSDWSPVVTECDLIICSDVVEHIEDPDKLLEMIGKISFKTLVISTPERDIVRGKSHIGPPPNVHHVREWNQTEFQKYINDYFEVSNYKLLEDTQYITCHPHIVE